MPLSQDARLAVLAKVDAAQLGLTARVWLSVRLLLEAIELSTTRDGAVIQLRVLATKCRCDRRTVLRAAESGRRAGILSWTQERDDEGRQAANRWRIAWDRLASLAGNTDQIAALDCRGRPPDRDPRQSDSPVTLDGNLSLWTENCHSGFAALPLSESTLKQTSSYLPKTTSVGSSGAEAAEEEEDFNFSNRAQAASEVVEFLFSLGVDQAARACRVAREQGCDEAHIRALVAHWQSYGGGTPQAAWGPAGLYYRITRARPHIPPDRGWPAPSVAWQRQTARAETQPLPVPPRLATPPAERFTGSMVAGLEQLLAARRAARGARETLGAGQSD